jgi:hypothetical protein
MRKPPWQRSLSCETLTYSWCCCLAAFGTHVEIGAALALGKPAIIHAPNRETLETSYSRISHYHPRVKLLISEVIDVDEVLACMPI